MYMLLQYNALIRSRGHRAALVNLINQKEVVGGMFNQLRLALQRRTKDRPAQVIKTGLSCCFNSKFTFDIVTFISSISLKVGSL